MAVLVAAIVALAVVVSGTAAFSARPWRRRSRGPADTDPAEPAMRQRLILEEWRNGELVNIGTVVADARDPLEEVDDTDE
jgi:hypothetical protein